MVQSHYAAKEPVAVAADVNERDGDDVREHKVEKQASVHTKDLEIRDGDGHESDFEIREIRDGDGHEDKSQ